MAPRATPEVRFWRYVDTGGECWLWTGATTRSGYGLLTVRVGKQEYAHRFSWRLHFGDIPAGLFACHKCDTPRCVRPTHLFLGTGVDNMADCRAKRRTNVGERNGVSKLTPEDVAAIRAKYAAGGVSMENVGREFGVSLSHVYRLVRRQQWQHI